MNKNEKKVFNSADSTRIIGRCSHCGGKLTSATEGHRADCSLYPSKRFNVKDIFKRIAQISK